MPVGLKECLIILIIGVLCGAVRVYYFLPSYIHDDILFMPILCACLACVLDERTVVSRVLSSKCMVHLGNMGLELFLVHTVIITGMNILGNLVEGFNNCFIQLVATITVAMVIYKINTCKVIDEQ